jgi:biopolymer transport protein ExbD
VKLKKPDKMDISPNMTPIMDMVFNLLIFFVLTAQFAKLEVEDVVLPISSKAEVKDYLANRNVVINVVHKADDDQIIVFGKVYTGEELRDRLIELHQTPGWENMNVILRADGDTPYEKVALVMLMTGAAKIENWWITCERDKNAE